MARRRLSTIALSVAMLGLPPASTLAQDRPAAGPACAAFAPTPKDGDTTITGVGFEATDDVREAVCVVRGRIASAPTSTIHFRVDLPAADHWNAKLLTVGGGGFDGVVPTESPSGLWLDSLLGPDAERVGGYAIVSSDSGHQGRGERRIADFSWAAGNPAAIRNHGYEANHRALLVATEVVRQFYGKAPSRRYIIGGSNGGRAGLAAIQRHPEDYDGVIALEPAISQEGFAANLTGMFQHIFSSPDHWMNEAEIRLFERAELAACDALDGLADGILGNVAACDFDGRPLRCKKNQRDSDSCLTEGQLESVRRIYADKQAAVTLADGVVGYPGYGRGAQSQDWPVFIFGPSFAARTAADYVLADNIVKHGITNDPNASVMTHDPTQWAEEYLALSSEIDATNPDLRAFHQRKGRLIVWFGLSDYCVTYRRTAAYLDAVKAKVGSQAAAELFRFYVSPATGHSITGPGASTAPLLSALEEWVEHDRAPDGLVATLSEGSAAPGATRPLCEYPAFPRYRGQGDPKAASSFDCAQPSTTASPRAASR